MLSYLNGYNFVKLVILLSFSCLTLCNVYGKWLRDSMCYAAIFFLQNKFELFLVCELRGWV